MKVIQTYILILKFVKEKTYAFKKHIDLQSPPKKLLIKNVLRKVYIFSKMVQVVCM